MPDFFEISDRRCCVLSGPPCIIKLTLSYCNTGESHHRREGSNEEIESEPKPAIGGEVHEPRLGMAILKGVELSHKLPFLLIGSDGPQTMEGAGGMGEYWTTSCREKQKIIYNTVLLWHKETSDKSPKMQIWDIDFILDLF